MKQKVGEERKADLRTVSRRSQLELRMDILRAIMEGAEGPTQIMYKANVSWILLIDNLSVLANLGFVGEKTAGKHKKYSLTGKGIELVGAYLNMLSQVVFETIEEATPTNQGEYQQLSSKSKNLRKAFGVDGRKVHQGKFTVILRKEEGGYSVRCVELPGAISEGKTKKEALENIREAIQGYLEAFPEEESRLKVRNEVVQLAI